MKPNCFSSRRLPLLCAGLALTVTTAPLRAGDPATQFAVEGGFVTGTAELPGADADLRGFAAGFQWEVGELLFSDFSLRGDFVHLESENNVAFKRNKLDLDARATVTFIGFLNPYVGLGTSFAHSEAPGYIPEDKWTPGYALSGGVGITILPALLHTTPSLRYAHFEDLETLTYSLDTAFHFALFGVGVRLDYEDNLSRDGNIFTGVLYGTFRF
jgi:opacity protein-like surface antigen